MRGSAIELDGSQHYETAGQAYDARRSAYLRSIGIRVIRFSNADVLNNLRGVCTEIDTVVLERIRSNQTDVASDLTRPR